MQDYFSNGLSADFEAILEVGGAQFALTPSPSPDRRFAARRGEENLWRACPPQPQIREFEG